MNAVYIPVSTNSFIFSSVLSAIIVFDCCASQLITAIKLAFTLQRRRRKMF